LNPDHH